METNLWDQLMPAFEAGNLKFFQRILKEVTCFDRITSSPEFEQICSTPHSSKFIQACLDKEYEFNKIKSHHLSNAIVNATKSLDPDNLKVILENYEVPIEAEICYQHTPFNLTIQNFNSRTANRIIKTSSRITSTEFATVSVGSKNMNIILANQTSICSDHISCMRHIPLHNVIDTLTSDNANQVFECFKVLLQYGANINCPSVDMMCHTPFTLLLEKLSTWPNDKIKQQFLEYVKEQVMFLDIHSYRKSETFELLKSHFPKLTERLIGESVDGKNEQQILRKLLEHLDLGPKKFIQELSYLYYCPELKERIVNILNDGKLFEEAILSGQYECVLQLLKFGANLSTVYPKSLSPILHACKTGNWQILQLLLDTFPNDNFKKLPIPLLESIICEAHTRERVKDMNDTIDYYKCFDITLLHKSVDINDVSSNGDTALKVAIDHGNKEFIKRCVEKSAFIGKLDTQGLPLFRHIEPTVLEKYFNSCITITEGVDEPAKIGISYSCFVSPMKSALPLVGELDPILNMAQTEKYKKLVQHPLITSLLFLKWLRMSPVFYFNFWFYSFGCASLITYIMFDYVQQDSEYPLAWYLSLLGAVYLTLREFCQFLSFPKQNMVSKTDFLEMILVLTVWLVLFSNGWFEEATRRGIGGLVILMSVMELIFLIEALPVFSVATQMMMLRAVSMSFIRIFALYSIMLTAFAFAFYSIFGLYGEIMKDLCESKDSEKCHQDEYNHFKSIGVSMLKTFVMFTGEFDAQSIKFHENVVGYVVFIVFIFFGGVVMMNLLNGLAVSDTQIIKSEADLNKWLMKARYMSKYEKTSLHMNWPMFKSEQRTITLLPNVLQQNRILIETDVENRILVPFINRHDQLQLKYFETPLSFFRDDSYIDPDIVKKAMLITGERIRKSRKTNNKRERNEENDSIATV